MREFYFSGTPYPSNVEIGEDASNNPAIGLAKEISSDNILFKEEVDDESDVELPSSSSDEFDPGIGIGESPLESRVKCFPNRPSNTLIVTHESPPAWFQPSESESYS